MSDLVHVLLRRDVRLEVPALAPLVAEALAVNVLDARRLARYARGVLAEDIPRTQASALQTALTARGVETLVVPASDYPSLPRPRRVVTVDLTDAGLAYKTDFRKPFEVIAWPALTYFSAGIVATPHYRDLLSSKQFKMLPALHKIEDPEARQELREKLATLSIKKRAESRVPDPQFRHRTPQDELESLYRDQTFGYLDLVTLQPFEHLRITRHEFRFDYLKARTASNSLENFKLLTRDLVERAADSLITNVTTALVEDVPVQELVFDHLGEFERYTTWFLYMAMNQAPPLGRAPVSVPERDFTQAHVEVARERRGTFVAPAPAAGPATGDAAADPATKGAAGSVTP